MSVPLPSSPPLADLAARFGGEPDDGASIVSAVAPIERASEGDLAPLLSRRYLAIAAESKAILLVDAAIAPFVERGRRWVHPRAGLALAELLASVAPQPPPDARASAHVDPLADVDPTAIVGQGAVILAGAVIGPLSRIEPNAVIYGGSRVGARVLVGAGAVIGRPGFGWVASASGAPMRVPQLGGVIIQDDAEVGPLATVDAGTLGPTVIGRGAKLDAHVHVGHNASVGAWSIVAAQSGFAGSVKLGEGCRVGGQAGFADHVSIGDGAQIAAQSGVIGDVEAGAVVAGYPAVGRARWLRAYARLYDRASAKRRRGDKE